MSLFEALADAFNVSEKVRTDGTLETTVPGKVREYIASLPERPRGIWASGIWAMCPRKLVLDFLWPLKSEANVRLQLFADSGTATHDMFQAYMAHAGILWGDWQCSRGCGHRFKRGFFPGAKCPGLVPRRRRTRLRSRLRSYRRCKGRVVYKEIKIRDKESGISAKADGYVYLDDVEWLFELKTISQGQFPKLDKPKDEHFYQVNIYMHIHQKKRAVVVYFNRNTMDMKEFRVYPDRALWEEAIDKIDHFKDIRDKIEETDRDPVYWAKADWPDRICDTPREDRAKYCDQCSICFDDRAIKLKREALLEVQT